MSDFSSGGYELGAFGNIWVKMNVLHRAGQYVDGHTHSFDHVSLLVKGKVEVEIEGYPPKEFTAPTFIVIRKEHRHKFTALEDDSVWYCVFALSDIQDQFLDEVKDIFAGKHDPMGLGDNAEFGGPLAKATVLSANNFV
jgi:hypothetical protein